MADDDLDDAERLMEIELVGAVVAAAAASDRHLTPDEIDEVLGVVADAGTPGTGCGVARIAR